MLVEPPSSNALTHALTELYSKQNKWPILRSIKPTAEVLPWAAQNLSPHLPPTTSHTNKQETKQTLCLILPLLIGWSRTSLLHSSPLVCFPSTFPQLSKLKCRQWKDGEQKEHQGQLVLIVSSFITTDLNLSSIAKWSSLMHEAKPWEYMTTIFLVFLLFPSLTLSHFFQLPTHIHSHTPL